MSLSTANLAGLPTIPAEMMDAEGWYVANRALPAIGKFVVSRDGRPEAVILPIAEFRELCDAVNTANRHAEQATPRSSEKNGSSSGNT